MLDHPKVLLQKSIDGSPGKHINVTGVADTLVKIFGHRTLDEISNMRLFHLKQRTLPWAFDICVSSRKEQPWSWCHWRDAGSLLSITWERLATETSKDPDIFREISSVPSIASYWQYREIYIIIVMDDLYPVKILWSV